MEPLPEAIVGKKPVGREVRESEEIGGADSTYY